VIVWTFYRLCPGCCMVGGWFCCQERAWELAGWFCGHVPAEPSNISGPEYIPPSCPNSLLRGQVGRGSCRQAHGTPGGGRLHRPCAPPEQRRSVWRWTQGDGYLHFGRRSQRDQALDTRPVPDFCYAQEPGWKPNARRTPSASSTAPSFPPTDLCLASPRGSDPNMSSSRLVTHARPGPWRRNEPRNASRLCAGRPFRSCSATHPNHPSAELGGKAA